jgi:hypothetical protein
MSEGKEGPITVFLWVNYVSRLANLSATVPKSRWMIYFLVHGCPQAGIKISCAKSHVGLQGGRDKRVG